MSEHAQRTEVSIVIPKWHRLWRITCPCGWRGTVWLTRAKARDEYRRHLGKASGEGS